MVVLYIPLYGAVNLCNCLLYHLNRIISADRSFKNMENKTVELYLDGEEVDLNPFAGRIISGALLGMIGELKDVEEPDEVVLKIRTR